MSIRTANLPEQIHHELKTRMSNLFILDLHVFHFLPSQHFKIVTEWPVMTL